MATVTELVTKFTFKGSLAPLTEFNAGLKKSIGVLSASALAIKASVGAFALFAIETGKSIQSLKNLSDQTGISVEKIQELSYAASMLGSSTEALQGTLTSLTAKIGQAAFTGSEEFARLGISVRDSFGNIKDADKVLDEISQRFKELNLSLPEQQTLAQSLGIDISLIRMLKTSQVEMEKLKQKAIELGIVGEKQTPGIEKFNNSITTLRFGLQALQNRVMIGLAPAMENIADRFTDFLIANKELISNGLEKTFNVLESLSASVNRLTGFVWDTVEATIGWKGALIAIGAVFAVLNPVKALITGILLVVDDLIVAFKGGKSVIRGFFLEFFNFDVTPVLQDIAALLKAITSDLKTGFSFIGSPQAREEFQKNGKSEVAGWARSKDWTKAPFDNSNPAAFIDPSLFKGLPIAGQGNSSNVNNNVVNKIEIKINSTDPRKAGEETVHAVSNYFGKFSLQNQLQNANAQIPNGGR